MGSRAKLPAQPRVLNQTPRQVSTFPGSAPWAQFSWLADGLSSDGESRRRKSSTTDCLTLTQKPPKKSCFVQKLEYDNICILLTCGYGRKSPDSFKL
jgi:hypothetical protein